MAKVRDRLFVLQKSTNKQNRRFGAKKLAGSYAEQRTFGLQ